MDNSNTKIMMIALTATNDKLVLAPTFSKESSALLKWYNNQECILLEQNEVYIEQISGKIREGTICR
jgi:hypothetical protein